MIKRLLYILILFLFTSTGFATIYVDCSDTGSTDQGTFAEPYNSLADLAGHGVLSTSEDLYFKQDTTCTLTQHSDRVVVDWTGTSGDRVIIGCYEGAADFECSGARPILDGDGTGGDDDSIGSYPTSQGVISINVSDSYDYITVQDIKIQYSGYYGITAKFSDNVNVDNCHVYRPVEVCIVYAQGINTGIISDNICENPGYTAIWPATTGAGGGIVATAQGSEASTTNITITGNKVFGGKHEGIGANQKATYITIENNVVRDMTSHHIYVDSAKNITIRYNVVYESTTADPNGKSEEGGIVIDDERDNGYYYVGDNEIYGNLIANMGKGLSLGCQILACTGVGVPFANCAADYSTSGCYDNTKIYNNILVDNTANIRFWAPYSGDTLLIKNNLSVQHTDGQKHIHGDTDSPAGVTFDTNLWWDDMSSADTVGGNAATSAVTGDPSLEKTSGWQSITANSLDGTEFQATVGGAGIDAGISIASYNDRITASDFTASPITITIQTIGSNWDIGAWEYGVDDAIVLGIQGGVPTGGKIE